jgi:hypothetical protein
LALGAIGDASTTIRIASWSIVSSISGGRGTCARRRDRAGGRRRVAFFFFFFYSSFSNFVI